MKKKNTYSLTWPWIPGRLFIRIAVLFCKFIIDRLQCELQNVQEANYEYQWIKTWNRINKQKEIRL